MKVICIILARAGSKGLPGKNVAELAGRPMIAWTIDHALAAQSVDRIVVSTDGPAIAAVAAECGVEALMRPADLASDSATVDSAARHAVDTIEKRDGVIFDAAVILYGNIPIRPSDLVDRAVEKLIATGADSVQSVYPVGKTHPYWMKKLGGAAGDVLEQYQPNNVYRRQDLPPVYMLDGGIIAVTRKSLFNVKPSEPHAFLGSDRRAIVTGDGQVVDIDALADFHLAKVVMKSNRRPRHLEIAGRIVGPGRDVYVVAELGVNHDGKLDHAIELTRMAKQVGADAIKLQLFDPVMLLSAEAILAEYQESSADDPMKMLQELQLSVEQITRVIAEARKLGLGFVVTCFSIELAGQLAKMNVDAVKVASPDAVNLPMIQALAELRKPMLISTGTCTINELAPAMRLCEARGLSALLLHCVSAYPVEPDSADLTRIARLEEAYGLPVGYSDHVTEPVAGAMSVAAGACLIEKHLTYDRAARGPDHAASFDAPQFTEYVRLIRQAQRMMRSPPPDVDAQADVRKVSRQSVCALIDLPAGHVIRRQDVTVKRPGTGIPAVKLEAVVGKKMKRTVKANHLLHEGDL